MEPFSSQTFLWSGEKLECIFKDLNVALVGTLMTFLDILVVFFLLTAGKDEMKHAKDQVPDFPSCINIKRTGGTRYLLK